MIGMYLTAGFMFLSIAHARHRATALGEQPVDGNEYDLEIPSS